MADATSSIFNKRATEKLRNPDDLDKYVRVTNPSVWVVLGACGALLAGLLAWGFFGAVTTSVATTGVSVDSKAMCFVPAEEVAKVSVGDIAFVGGTRMEVSEVASVPLSRDEARSLLGSDYLVSSLFKGDWAYQVRFTGDTKSLASGVPLTVNITVDRVAPINLIFGGNA